ncbi:MAG TPA: Ppx/GppA phosphatase family protein [Thermoanaerobaculaceae bacterium]|nr:Ppx/GppA phosphatase family protein [Thermoanaerobaculaceae bacterium]
MAATTRSLPGAAATAPAPVGFPLRVGVVDVGSNAIRYQACEFTAADRFSVLDSRRASVRLGHGVFLSGRLAEPAIEAAVAALVSFVQAGTALGITRWRAVATSATREAANGAELVARVKAAVGLELEAISGAEEARLVHLAVANRVPLGRDPWWLVDLGGGSVEVSLADGSGVLWSESHTVGSVRLLEALTQSDEEPGRFRELLEEYVSGLRLPSAERFGTPTGFIATGGNIEALARLGEPAAASDVTVYLPLARLRAVIDTLARLSFRQRVDELGLREDRADVVLPAAMVYERLANLAGCSEIVVPFVGLKDGVALDFVDELTAARAHADRQERDTVAAATALGRHYAFDEDHARKVADLALSLFDQLSERHGLGPRERRILLAAALLHEIGQFIGFKGHHKHTLYLLIHSDLAGFPPSEMELVANVARYHRRSEPDPSHWAYAGLPSRDRSRVERLAAILRVADALDREHRQRVNRIEVSVSGKELTLRLVGEGDLLLERHFLPARAAMLARVLGLKLRVRQ